jgi:H(+)-translocating pyrophosphatase
MGGTINSSEWYCILVIYGCTVLGILWGIFNAFAVLNIEVRDDGASGNSNGKSLKERPVRALVDIGSKIKAGARAFLSAEYTVMTIFVFIFSIFVFILVDYLGQTDEKNRVFRVYATLSYLIGAFTSILCGYIGMTIAVEANFRTTFKAITSLAEAFNTALQAGCVMGFIMCGVSLGMLCTIMIIYILSFNPQSDPSKTGSYQDLMDLIAGYGLGGSSMALFGRVGGGIYTKAADVGADLVGKVEEGLDEDSPRNPATIADNVGDNVGDIAGMGSDLFGSFAEATCAALVLISGSFDALDKSKMTALWFPLMISAGGIIACFFTSIFGIYIYKVHTIDRIEKALNYQLMVSTAFMLAILYPVCTSTLPSDWNMDVSGTNTNVKWWYCYVSTALGLLSGFVIGLSTDYYTSNAHAPVQEMAGICTSGAAINVIYGLALGYLSCIIPIILLSITIIVGIYLLGMLGVALGAIGMLSTLCICLAIDAYGPISDNAGGIAEMAEIGDDVREKTDALDAAGNTTAAVGKGFAIGSAALVSLALYGAFLTRCQKGSKNTFDKVLVNDGWVFGSMFIGAMLPYFFSALTMKSVGKAANEMVEEVRRQFKDER